ncbi:hypothetical protein H261_10512 [Paramagnetospirillum caucaseum]|uniref:DUF6362 domain-containing protein n=1 Tax=Paramagnetospirillum caucaseum TaxID=1244869 RepID=M2Z6N8_9PROT|nr:DUF6362 family protein [Paramagnetospirillum caucaseum]EME69975.1 hypothetical protein H261_10512 [Paramagnetospirillum caucaseum]
MAEATLTPAEVEERLAEAADILRRLPESRVQGHASAWPPYVREYWESYGVAEVKLRRPPPSAAAITRMDEALPWLTWLDPTDAKIVWLRANGDRWKVICWSVGMQRSAVHQHWLYGLCVIAWRLRGQAVPVKRSRQFLIDRMQAVSR